MATDRVPAFELSQDVARLVTDDFLRGANLADLSDFRSKSTEITAIDRDGILRLEDEALSRFEPADAECDTWLSPRLHCLLRLTRRPARIPGFWRWMALEVMPRYVRHRWTKGGKVKAYRFLGGSNFLRRNAISRLWWGAESIRNGPDYRETDAIFRYSGVEQYVLDLRFGHLRPSALAFAKVATGRSRVRELKFEEMKELSKRANLLLSGTALESLAPPGHDEISEPDLRWLRDDPNPEVLIKQSLADLRGPSDGRVADEEIRDYEEWFSEVATDIVNGKSAT